MGNFDEFDLDIKKNKLLLAYSDDRSVAPTELTPCITCNYACAELTTTLYTLSCDESCNCGTEDFSKGVGQCTSVGRGMARC